MVCREASIGSAVTSYVLQTTSLQEQQVLSLYHEVMREGRSAATPSQATQHAMIDGFSDSVRHTSGLSDARRRSLLARLDRSRTEPMNGQRHYATTRLLDRARLAETAMNQYVADTARDLGITEQEARRRIDSLREAAASDRTMRPVDPDFVNTMRQDPTYAGLPLDRQTAVAVEAMQTARTANRSHQPARSTVAREEVFDSSVVREMGYNEDTGRCEVVLHSNPEAVYAYRMSPGEYANFRRAGSIGSYYATEIRGNSAYRYSDAESAAEAGNQTQCASCGQFAGSGHACPPQGSAEEMNRTVRRARAAARTRATARTTTAEPTPEADAATSAEPQEPVRVEGSRRRYNGESGAFRTVNLGSVQQSARVHGTVNVPVSATITHFATEAGPERCDTTGFITGSAAVTYNGRGRGYTATAEQTPGDSGAAQLQCTCPDYRRNYDCVHVRQTIQDINTRINQDALRTRHSIGEAISQVSNDLAADHADSVAAQDLARTNDTVSTVSYTDDHAAFQADYKAAKDRLAAGEAPVPYMTENATGGLGARGTGRAFGVELEFDIGPGVDRYTALRNIGRAMHAAGLTRTSSQTGYHSAERNGYTEDHQGGWSFEADCTVAGEIVSPIMYDEPETWQNLQKVCDIIKDNGGVVTQRTGSHVHVSAHNYDHTVENHNRLLGSFAENEDTIYRLSSNPERGTHRGPQWCSPNRVPTAGYSNIRDARYGNNSHGLGLNMQSVAGRESDHIEFRTYDASLDPSIIQTQVKMSLGITEAAFRDNDYQPGTHTPLGSHRSHNRQSHGASRRLTGEAWQQDTAGYRSFADRVFRRAEDKAQMTALFAITKWQRGTRR